MAKVELELSVGAKMFIYAAIRVKEHCSTPKAGLERRERFIKSFMADIWPVDM